LLDFFEGDLIVAAHLEFLPHLAKVLRQVIGERIVVVEKQDHFRLLCVAQARPLLVAQALLPVHSQEHSQEWLCHRNPSANVFALILVFPRCHPERSEGSAFAFLTPGCGVIAEFPNQNSGKPYSPRLPPPPPRCAISSALITARALFPDS
jgi:hypothetical protein